MKQLLCLFLSLLAWPAIAPAQLVVFDTSHCASPHSYYGPIRDQLTDWGYVVEQRSTPLMANSDADVIVILPEESFQADSPLYSAMETAWLQTFVAAGGGLLISVCPNPGYWDTIEPIMTAYGIALDTVEYNPVRFDQFATHPLFEGVTELGDDYIWCATMLVSPPCVPVAGDGSTYVMAVCENASGSGGALWTSHYYAMTAHGLDDYDNLIFLENAFAWLASGFVANADLSWSAIKSLYR